jgi:mono/diheme cytochrome c family protein
MRLLKYISCFWGCVLLCLTEPATWAQTTSAIPKPAPPTAAAQMAKGELVFDAEMKQYDAKPAEMSAPFTFKLSDVGTGEVVITKVKASCGCTTAKMPQTPWHLPPGGSGQVEAQVNLAGKTGLITKTLTFSTSIGNRVVTLKVKIPPPIAGSVPMTPAERQAAMMKAAAEPMAIFKGDCAACHVQKGAKAYGEELYAADCGICHESSNRASAVPDLHALKQPTGFDYWKAIITNGKPHTMMPPFALAQGGPLTDTQIDSLASYLNRTISHNFGSTKGPAASLIRTTSTP